MFRITDNIMKPKEEKKPKKSWSWAKSPLLHPVFQMLLNMLPRSISNLVTGEDPAFSSLSNTTRSRRDADIKDKVNIFNAYKQSKLIRGHKVKVHPAIPRREFPIRPRKRRDTVDDLEPSSITVYSSIHRTDPLREQDMYPVQEGLLNIERPSHSGERRRGQSNARKFQQNSRPNRKEIQYGPRHTQEDDRPENESNKHHIELDHNRRGEEGEEDRVTISEYSRKNYHRENIQPHNSEDEHSKHQSGFKKDQDDRRKHAEDADGETKSVNDRVKQVEDGDEERRWHTPSDNKSVKRNDEPQEEEALLRNYDEEEYRPQAKEIKYNPEIHEDDEEPEGIEKIKYSRKLQPESDHSDSREHINHPSNKEYDEEMQRTRHSERPEESEKYESETEVSPQNSGTLRRMQDRDQLYNIKKPEEIKNYGTSHYRSDANGGIQRKDNVRNSFPREEQTGQYNRPSSRRHQDNREHVEEKVEVNKYDGGNARRSQAHDPRRRDEFRERDEVLPNTHRQPHGSDYDRESTHFERANEQYNRNSQRKENLRKTDEEEQGGDKLNKGDKRKSLNNSEQVQNYDHSEDQYNLKDNHRGSGHVRERENGPVKTGERTQYRHSLDSRGEKNSAEDHNNAWNHDHAAKTYDETETHSRVHEKHVTNPPNESPYTAGDSIQGSRGSEEEEVRTSTKQQHKYRQRMRGHHVENPRASETDEGEITYNAKPLPRGERKQVDENERYPSDDHRRNVNQHPGHRRHGESHSSHAKQDPQMRDNNKPRSHKHTEKKAYKVQEVPSKPDDESEEYDYHNSGNSNHDGRILHGHSKVEEDPVTVHDHRRNEHGSRNVQEELRDGSDRYEGTDHSTHKHPSRNIQEGVRGRGDTDEETDHSQHKYPSSNMQEKLREGSGRYEGTDHSTHKHPSRNMQERVRGRGDKDEETDHSQHKYPSRNVQEELHDGSDRYEGTDHLTHKHPSRNMQEGVRRGKETNHPARAHPSRNAQERLRHENDRYEEADHSPHKHSSRKEVALGEELAGSTEDGEKYYPNNDEEPFNKNTDSKGINHAKDMEDSLHSPKGVISDYRHEDDEADHANEKEKIPTQTENLLEIRPYPDEDVDHEKLSDVVDKGLSAPEFITETVSDKAKTIPMSSDQLIQYIAERIPYPTTPRRDIALRGKELEREMKDFTESKIREIQSTRFPYPIVTDQQEPKRQGSAYYEAPETLAKEDSVQVQEELPLINQKQRMRFSAEHKPHERRIRFPENESERQYYEKSHQEDTHHPTRNFQGKENTEEHKQRDLPEEYSRDRSERLPDDVRQHEGSRVEPVQEGSTEEVVPTPTSLYIPNVPTDVSYESAQNRISLLQNGEQLDNIMMEDRLKNTSSVSLQKLKNNSSENESQDNENHRLRDTSLESKQHQVETSNRDRLKLSSPGSKYNNNSRQNATQRFAPTLTANATQSVPDERLVGPGDENQSNISQQNSKQNATAEERIVHFILPDYDHSEYTNGRWEDESELRKPIFNIAVATKITNGERKKAVEKDGNERPRRRTFLREEERDDLREPIHVDDVEGEKTLKEGGALPSTEEHYHGPETTDERSFKKEPHSQESAPPLPRRSLYITEDEVREAIASVKSPQAGGDDRSSDRDAGRYHTAHDGQYNGEEGEKRAEVQEDVEDLPQSSAKKEERMSQSEDVLKTIAKILEKKDAISRDDISGYDPKEYRNYWTLEYSGPKKT